MMYLYLVSLHTLYLLLNYVEQRGDEDYFNLQPAYVAYFFCNSGKRMYAQ